MTDPIAHLRAPHGAAAGHPLDAFEAEAWALIGRRVGMAEAPAVEARLAQDDLVVVGRSRGSRGQFDSSRE